MTKRYAKLAVLAVVVPLAAFTYGGWGVMTIVDVPESAVVGAPVTYTYEMRQHGVQIATMDGMVEATNGRRKVEALASNALGGGRRSAVVTFPEPGNWTVKVNTFAGHSLLPIRVVARGERPPVLSAVERGKHLFVAKGCVSCHTHQLVGKALVQHLSGVPDLSEPRFADAYLQRFLKDPSIKASTAQWPMPNLNLKDAEITALVAFLNQETRAAARR